MFSHSRTIERSTIKLLLSVLSCCPSAHLLCLWNSSRHCYPLKTTHSNACGDHANTLVFKVNLITLMILMIGQHLFIRLHSFRMLLARRLNFNEGKIILHRSAFILFSFLCGCLLRGQAHKHPHTQSQVPASWMHILNLNIFTMISCLHHKML